MPTTLSISDSVFPVNVPKLTNFSFSDWLGVLVQAFIMTPNMGAHTINIHIHSIIVCILRDYSTIFSIAKI